MLGWGGREVSIAEASFDLATEEGRVSGSKRAPRTRASLADSVEEGDATAIVERLFGLEILGGQSSLVVSKCREVQIFRML
jgi:hypothetical protein